MGRTNGKMGDPSQMEMAASSAAARPQGTGLDGPDPPDPEVPAKAVRRSFSAEYKQRILREADTCQGDGAIGALLRREGLYSSHLATWRRQRTEAMNQALGPHRRGKTARPHPLVEENEKLRQENAHLMERLQQAELIIEVQKKISGLMGSPAPHSETGENHWCGPSNK